MAGTAGRGMSGRGTAWQGSQGVARRGGARPGEARPGKAVKAWRGRARHVRARHGGAWQARLGVAWQGAARQGEARRGRHGVENNNTGRTPAMDLRKHLTDIYMQHGELTPAIVVEEATNPLHPLHDRFEWDDTKAASKYREIQAGDLIRSVKITYSKEPEKSVRAFWPVRHTTDDPRTSYTPIEEVVDDPMTRAIMLRQMDMEWRQFKARWEHMDEFATIVRQVAS